VLLQHPVTDEADDAHGQAVQTLVGMVKQLSGWIALWPGQDAGADGVSKALREQQWWLHTVRNLPPNRFLRLLTQASVLVGNSSAGIRECAYLGVPVVDIGTRQRNRERGKNVLHVHHDSGEIASAIQRQVAHGRYESSALYGDGSSGERIAAVLAEYADGSIREAPSRDAVLELRREGGRMLAVDRRKKF
jgi:hypothetical protein